MMQTSKPVRAMAVGVAAVAVMAGGMLAVAQQGGGHGGHFADQRAAHAGGQQDIGMMLINGLRESPGCLGVDAGDMMSGKNIIVAWFENKAAVEKWYYSQTHMRSMKMFVRGEVDKEPLEHVTDPSVPIMVIASITPSTEEELAQIGMPISQIAIELYAPLPGGAYITGRFAPDSFPVEHMNNLTGGG